MVTLTLPEPDQGGIGKLRLREAWGYNVRSGEPGLQLGDPLATMKNPDLGEGTSWGAGVSWGRCGAIVGLK